MREQEDKRRRKKEGREMMRKVIYVQGIRVNFHFLDCYSFKESMDSRVVSATLLFRCFLYLFQTAR